MGKKKKKSDKKILIDNLVSEREIKSLMNKKMKEKKKGRIRTIRTIKKRYFKKRRS